METKIKSILIPTDFSELAESALKVGIAVAKRQGSEISLLHILDRMAYLQPTEVFVPAIKIAPDYKSEIKERIKKLAHQIMLDTGIKVTGKVLEGIPSEEICKYAFNRKISLIVMGTHGISGLREFFIGSESFRVVRNAHCPVLTVPGDWRETNFERVLFPVRLKPGAIDKYLFARPIIEKNNSELLLLGLADQKSPKLVKELVLLIDQLKLKLHEDNVEFQTAYCPSNDFPNVVLETAKKQKVDLIVITANLEYDFKAYFIGPYAQQIINHSRIPVLSIKPDIIQVETKTPMHSSDKDLAQLRVRKLQQRDTK